MLPKLSRRIEVTDSHTAGEPTRVVMAGGPDLGNGALADRLKIFREKYDHFRSAVVNEPRGSDAMVGALLCKPVDTSCAAGVIFFNNVGYLGGCGHGTIGLVVTLGQAGLIQPGTHRIETPVGVVTATLEEANTVTFRNVASYRSATGISIDVDGVGRISGDVAWGGNWFFLTDDHGQELRVSNIERLTEVAWNIRQTLTANGIRGADGKEIDHIELFGPPTTADADGKNFVLCPGKAYDRSPCGTGTSAKIACLIEAGKLKPGQTWRQESIIGTIFDGSAEVDGQTIIPSIRGRAYVNAQATLVLDENDPLQLGMRG